MTPNGSQTDRRRALHDAMRAAGFNQSRAARALGVSRETVRLRLLAAGGLEALAAWAAGSEQCAAPEQAAAREGEASTMSTNGSSVRVEGENRAFLKRLALEVTLQSGTAREDMSHVVGLMIEHFRREGDAAAVATVLLTGEGTRPDAGDR